MTNGEGKALAPGSPPRKPGGRLRVVGLVILLLGVGIAGARFWASPSASDSLIDLPTADTSKKVSRQIESNFGKTGLLASDLSNSLHNPATQAAIIAGASILLAAGCFYVARLLDRAD